MARVTVPKNLAPGSYGIAGVTLTETAADTSNFNQFLMTGAELLLARNSNAGSTAHTVTITSVTDDRGRAGTITAESIAAGAAHAFGPFTKKLGWAQSNGYLYFQANHAEILFSVIQLPTL